MPIVPDTKNWTWVIERRCDECGFDASSVARTDVSAMLLTNAAQWPAELERADVRVRPDDSTWSTLEYAAHVRDVITLYRERTRLMVETDDPLYPNWDQDSTAIADRYNDQDPSTVADQIAAAAAALARDFDALDGDQWQRPGRRSDGAAFTVATMAVYFLHDIVHHLHDVRKHEQPGS